MNVAVATAELPRVVVLTPDSRQVIVPLALLQANDLPALMDADEAAMETAVKSEEEYVSVHCNAAGWVPPDKVRSTDTLLPRIAETVAELRMPVWASERVGTRRMGSRQRMRCREKGVICNSSLVLGLLVLKSILTDTHRVGIGLIGPSG